MVYNAVYLFVTTNRTQLLLIADEDVGLVANLLGDLTHVVTTGEAVVSFGLIPVRQHINLIGFGALLGRVLSGLGLHDVLPGSVVLLNRLVLLGVGLFLVLWLVTHDNVVVIASVFKPLVPAVNVDVRVLGAVGERLVGVLGVDGLTGAEGLRIAVAGENGLVGRVLLAGDGGLEGIVDIDGVGRALVERAAVRRVGDAGLPRCGLGGGAPYLRGNPPPRSIFCVRGLSGWAYAITGANAEIGADVQVIAAVRTTLTKGLPQVLMA